MLAFKECINKFVVAGTPDCKIPIPIQKSIISFLKKVNKGVAIIGDKRAYSLKIMIAQCKYADEIAGK